MEFRDIIAEEVQLHWDVYEAYAHMRDVASVVKAIRTEGNWGDHLEIAAFSRCMNCTIVIHQVDTDDIVFERSDPATTIELAYLGRNHYDLLIAETLETTEPTFGLHQTSSRQFPSETSSDQLNAGGAEKTSDKIVSKAQDYVPASVTLTSMLQSVLLSREATVQWLTELDILPKTMECYRCHSIMRRRFSVAKKPDGDFYCSKCKRCASPRSKTLFSFFRLDPQLFVQVIFHWFSADSRENTARETAVSVRTITRYREILLSACVVLLMKQNRKIGGPNRVVEIDECLLHRRKYQRGRLKELGWVLGGIERPRTPDEVPRLFLEKCSDRKQETLEALITKWVLPGTVIVTDSFKSYNHLDRLGYYHYNVNHSVNFVDPSSLAHTQRIEGLWHWVRAHALPKCGVKLGDLDFYLSAYIYKRFINNNIITFLKDLGKLSVDEVRAVMMERREGRLEDESSESSSSGTEETHTVNEYQEEDRFTPSPSFDSDRSVSESQNETNPMNLLSETFISSPKKARHTLSGTKPASQLQSFAEEDRMQHRNRTFQRMETRQSSREKDAKTAAGRRRARFQRELQNLRKH